MRNNGMVMASAAGVKRNVYSLSLLGLNSRP